MGIDGGRSERIRTALFVDFDNIQINLADDNRDAAAAFARNPERWVDRLSQRAASLYPDTANCRRKIILRRCYMNPQRFADFRPDFIRRKPGRDLGEVGARPLPHLPVEFERVRGRYGPAVVGGKAGLTGSGL